MNKFLFFLVISPLIRKWVLSEKMFKYVTPLLGQPPPPHFKVGDIFGNYERISTKFSVINLLAVRWELGDKF